MPKPITEDEFRNIKSKLRWSKPELVAQRVKRHRAIVLKIQASKDGYGDPANVGEGRS